MQHDRYGAQQRCTARSAGTLCQLAPRHAASACFAAVWLATRTEATAFIDTYKTIAALVHNPRNQCKSRPLPPSRGVGGGRRQQRNLARRWLQLSYALLGLISSSSRRKTLPQRPIKRYNVSQEACCVGSLLSLESPSLPCPSTATDCSCPSGPAPPRSSMAGLVESNTGTGVGSSREQQLLDVLGRFDGEQAWGILAEALPGVGCAGAADRHSRHHCHHCHRTHAVHVDCKCVASCCVSTLLMAWMQY